jgi:BirA family biotin operon repressor/biotin-[acetyl-CoA-carboxylase] ligase
MIIGSKIKYLDSLPSTNTYAAQLLKSEKPQEGLIIHAGFQSGGRGQSGNSWESEAGKNLLISIILYPTTINPEDQFIISMAISLGICDYIDQKTAGSKIKWPNDIYVNDDKIAGILIENSIMAGGIENCIAGIGLNINQMHFQSNAPNPVSLSQITGKEYDLSAEIMKLSSFLDKRYKQIIAEDNKNIVNGYMARLFRLNEWHRYSDSSDEFEGRIISVREDGKISIEKSISGIVTEYLFKEVEFIL